MNSSPERGSFQRSNRLKQVETGEKTAEDIQPMLDFYARWEEERKKQELDPEWQKQNLEYDLRSTKWICDKAKANESYAQNIYAALCNNDFTKNEVWPLLTEQRWSCSWRSAGGIVANMVETGDYIDWYCSGIIGDMSDEEYHNLDKAGQERYLYMKTHFVGEGVVTEEVCEDFLKLGWIVIEEN